MACVDLPNARNNKKSALHIISVLSSIKNQEKQRLNPALKKNKYGEELWAMYSQKFLYRVLAPFFQKNR
jgi:hypothetical protein